MDNNTDDLHPLFYRPGPSLEEQRKEAQKELDTRIAEQKELIDLKKRGGRWVPPNIDGMISAYDPLIQSQRERRNRLLTTDK